MCFSPPGGRLSIHVTSEGLTRENGVFPDLRVTLRSQELHAPLVERIVELPLDITAGAAYRAATPSLCSAPFAYFTCCQAHVKVVQGPACSSERVVHVVHLGLLSGRHVLCYGGSQP